MDTAAEGAEIVIPSGPQPARFAEPPRESDAETARWDEYRWLGQCKVDLGQLIAKLEAQYPVLDLPDDIAAACELLEQAGDLLRKRAGQLENGE